MESIISVQDIRTSLGSIADRAERGESFTVVRSSKPVFRIVPIETPSAVREPTLEYVTGKRDATAQRSNGDSALTSLKATQKLKTRDPLRRDPSLKGAVFHGDPFAPTDEADWPEELR